jgi:hypothetical protein
LEFRLHAVRVVDGAGALVGEFTCEDDPADFDAEAGKRGWVRVGMLGGDVLLDRVGSPAPAPALAPQPEPVSVSGWELAGSAVWSLVKLGVVVLVVLGFVAACARLIF